jgi:GT2 family glycosyltransferase
VTFQDTGIVVIGRNEGERLQRCLDTLVGRAALVVYADSASTDGSAAAARARGIAVVELDPRARRNAARGRNAGLARLLERRADLRYVLFLDGDCLLVEGFLERARECLETDPHLGAVCGRRREIQPEASRFNRAVDLEWDTPVGEARAFGGDVLVRLAALEQCGAYDERMDQGEDPELAFRLRQRGWRILRIDRDMTLHDVALHRFAAWWKRHERGGLAFAHGAWLHRGDPGRYNQRECASILFWGLALPATALALVPWTGGLSLALLAAHGVLWLRVRAHRRARGRSSAEAGSYATWVTLGKLAEALGLLQMIAALVSGRAAQPVEYKDYQRRDAA